MWHFKSSEQGEHAMQSIQSIEEHSPGSLEVVLSAQSGRRGAPGLAACHHRPGNVSVRGYKQCCCLLAKWVCAKWQRRGGGAKNPKIHKKCFRTVPHFDALRFLPHRQVEEPSSPLPNILHLFAAIDDLFTGDRPGKLG